MKRMVCLVVAVAVTWTPLTGLGAQDQTRSTLQGVVLPGTGVISGTVASSSGRRLSGIAMQLVNPKGIVVGKTMTMRNGEFTFAPASYDLYTVQCMDDDRVVGTSSLTLMEAMRSVDMTCSIDPGYWKKWGLLMGLGAAATAIGAVAVVARQGDASGAR
jgi:hypothetical protein